MSADAGCRGCGKRGVALVEGRCLLCWVNAAKAWRRRHEVLWDELERLRATVAEAEVEAKHIKIKVGTLEVVSNDVGGGTDTIDGQPFPVPVRAWTIEIRAGEIPKVVVEMMPWAKHPAPVSDASFPA